MSTPLAWDEVNDQLNPSIYTMAVVLDRVRAHGDLYAGRADDAAVAVEGAQAPGLTGCVRAASFATESSLPSITA